MSRQDLSDWSVRRSDVEKTWLALNEKLKKIHENEGLYAAFSALFEHHSHSVFIQDDLAGVVRYRLENPHNPKQFYSGQFNPKRAERFGGFGRREPPVPEARIHDGCFLCMENILWQHEGNQLGMEFLLGEAPYVVLTNPFPLMPMHSVVAARHHMPQACGIRMEKGQQGHSLETILDHILTLAGQLPNSVVFYNGVGAGASIPQHFHFQTFERPRHYGLFPLEQVARRQGSYPCWIERDYPLPSRVWHGPKDEIHGDAHTWIAGWVRRNDENVHNLTANLIASLDDTRKDHLFLYFVPRTRQSVDMGLSSSVNVGGLEVLGEMVFTLPEEKRKLDSGELDYAAINRMLSSVGTATTTSFPHP